MLQTIFSPISKILDRVVCVVSALLFTQIPIYINQYLNVLSGRLGEAKTVYSEMEQAARNQDMDLSLIHI